MPPLDNEWLSDIAGRKRTEREREEEAKKRQSAAVNPLDALAAAHGVLGRNGDNGE